jgi:sporulation protein YunB
MLQKISGRHKMNMLAAAMAIFLLLAAGIAASEYFLRKPLIKAAENRVNNMMQEAVYRGLNKSSEELGYDKKLVQIERDNGGRIVFVQTDSLYASKLAGEIASYINKEIEANERLVKVPLGAVFVNSSFSSYGPEVNLKIAFAAAQNVSLSQEAISAGINQTKHLIYLNAEIKTSIIAPLADEMLVTKVKIPLAEYILIGSVPDTYVNLEQ